MIYTFILILQITTIYCIPVKYDDSDSGSSTVQYTSNESEKNKNTITTKLPVAVNDKSRTSADPNNDSLSVREGSDTEISSISVSKPGKAISKVDVAKLGSDFGSVIQSTIKAITETTTPKPKTTNKLPFIQRSYFGWFWYPRVQQVQQVQRSSSSRSKSSCNNRCHSYLVYAIYTCEYCSYFSGCNCCKLED